MDSNLALFRQAVLARKAVLAYTGDPRGFRPVISASWRATRAYADATQTDYAEAHRTVCLAAYAAS
jgi:hypothetical protein